jgi:hypothetical protein
MIYPASGSTKKAWVWISCPKWLTLQEQRPVCDLLAQWKSECIRLASTRWTDEIENDKWQYVVIGI